MAMARARAAVDLFPWEVREKYVTWLGQSYFFVKHSTRLLALSAPNCAFSNNKTHKRMAKHIFEEIGHETLAANDLLSLGMTVTDIKESPLTKAFYRLQYYGIERMGASYLMGYILFLEGVASVLGPSMLARVVSAHGEKSATFLKLHAEEDIGHVESAFENLEIANDTEARGILESLEISTSLYLTLLKAISDEPQKLERVSNSDLVI